MLNLFQHLDQILKQVQDDSMIISGTVIKGTGAAKKLSAPTLNINPRHAPKGLKQGVYAVRVQTKIGDFSGALYFGPRFHSPHKIALEVHCIGLKKNLYRTRVSIHVGKRLRGVKHFASMAAAKKTIAQDIKKIRVMSTN